LNQGLFIGKVPGIPISKTKDALVQKA